MLPVPFFISAAESALAGIAALVPVGPEPSHKKRGETLGQVGPHHFQFPRAIVPSRETCKRVFHSLPVTSDLAPVSDSSHNRSSSSSAIWMEKLGGAGQEITHNSCAF